MSDLISRKALANELQKYFVNNTIHKNDLAEVLATRPTAFDVEAVVKELQETNEALCDHIICCKEKHCEICVVNNFLSEQIEIVRKGGVK